MVRLFFRSRKLLPPALTSWLAVDVIFFIYLYQRWIYPVDNKRRNEYGQIEEKADPEVDAKEPEHGVAPIMQMDKKEEPEGGVIQGKVEAPRKGEGAGSADNSLTGSKVAVRIPDQATASSEPSGNHHEKRENLPSREAAKEDAEESKATADRTGRPPEADEDDIPLPPQSPQPPQPPQPPAKPSEGDAEGTTLEDRLNTTSAEDE